MILLIIERNLPGAARRPIEPEAELADLGADGATRPGIAMALSEVIDRDIPDAEMLAWQTVADAMVSAWEGGHV